jgi:phosphoribosylanthranilate isomerase
MEEVILFSWEIEQRLKTIISLMEEINTNIPTVQVFKNASKEYLEHVQEQLAIFKLYGGNIK